MGWNFRKVIGGVRAVVGVAGSIKRKYVREGRIEGLQEAELIALRSCQLRTRCSVYTEIQSRRLNLENK